MKKGIVLVHGLFMRKEIMLAMQKRLSQLGYQVYNFNYNTLKFDDDTIEHFKTFVEQIEEKQLYFVGHSLGGLLIRFYLENNETTHYTDSAVITLGTPHKGSEIARKVAEIRPLRFLHSTIENAKLDDGIGDYWQATCPIGCIIGTLNFGVKTIVDRKKEISDGTVLAQEAAVDNATDIIKLPINHTALIFSTKVIEQVDHFIKHKKFNHNS